MPFGCPKLHDLLHKFSHLLRSLLLCGSCGVGVGLEGEPCIVVPQHGGDRFDVYSALESHGSEGVTEIVEPNAGKSRVLQDTLVECGDGIRMVHFPGGTGWEQVGALRVFGVFLDEEVYRLLWDGHFTDGCLGLGPGELQTAVWVANILLADRHCFVLSVDVIPPEGGQFPLPKSADQLQIEHGQGVALFCCMEVGFDILWLQDLHLLLYQLGGDAVLSGVVENEPLLPGPIQGTVKHKVDAADGAGGKPPLFRFLDVLRPAILSQVFVEALEVPAGQIL